MGAPYYVLGTSGQSNGQGGQPLDPLIDQVVHPRIWAVRQGTTTIEEAIEPLAKVAVPQGFDRIGCMLPLARALLNTPGVIPATHDLLLCHGNIAGSGFSNDQWNPGDETYENWIDQFTYAMGTHADNVLLCAIHQGGEEDSATMSQSEWTTALSTMIADFRSRVPQGATCPFIIGEMPEEILENNAGTLPIYLAQRAVADEIENTVCARSTDLPSHASDHVHFSPASSRTMGGERYLNALLSLGWRRRLTWS